MTDTVEVQQYNPPSTSLESVTANEDAAANLDEVGKARDPAAMELALWSEPKSLEIVKEGSKEANAHDITLGLPESTAVVVDHAPDFDSQTQEENNPTDTANVPTKEKVLYYSPADYEFLGIKKDATYEQVTFAFREYAKKYHPDTAANGKGDAKLFQEATEAYGRITGNTNQKNEAYAEQRKKDDLVRQEAFNNALQKIKEREEQQKKRQEEFRQRQESVWQQNAGYGPSESREYSDSASQEAQPSFSNNSQARETIIPPPESIRGNQYFNEALDKIFSENPELNKSKNPADIAEVLINAEMSTHNVTPEQAEERMNNILSRLFKYSLSKGESFTNILAEHTDFGQALRAVFGLSEGSSSGSLRGYENDKEGLLSLNEFQRPIKESPQKLAICIETALGERGMNSNFNTLHEDIDKVKKTGDLICLQKVMTEFYQKLKTDAITDTNWVGAQRGILFFFKYIENGNRSATKLNENEFIPFFEKMSKQGGVAEYYKPLLNKKTLPFIPPNAQPIQAQKAA